MRPQKPNSVMGTTGFQTFISLCVLCGIVQTFLPYEDFRRSAECLDDKRLGKQRVEVLQILRALRGETKGWRNHPATLMWKGHEGWLSVYGEVVCLVWKLRGFRDTCQTKIHELGDYARPDEYPPWLGDEAFHSTHRAVLLDKDPEWYGRFGWSEQPAHKVGGRYPYVWPTTIST